jgi:thiosulfate/3-mercaptopyruvate sulfurtransferase
MIKRFVSSGLIEPAELNALIEAETPNLKILDCTYVIAGTGPHGRIDFAKRRIDRAVFFDIDEIADRKTSLPHMLPSRAEFDKGVSALGISNDDFIVCYSQGHMGMASARAWWMFHLFGHERVCVLNGGLGAWIAENLPLNTAPPDPYAVARFQSTAAHTEWIEDFAAMKRAGDALVLDARPEGRFKGEVPEPRPNLFSGHIPGSRNLPGPSLLDAAGKMKSKSEMESLFKAAGYSRGQKTIATCGSGAVACLLILAMFHAGIGEGTVYDGSWAEWGQEKAKNPVATGV